MLQIGLREGSDHKEYKLLQGMVFQQILNHTSLQNVLECYLI
jgi:hypothetical protein